MSEKIRSSRCAESIQIWRSFGLEALLQKWLDPQLQLGNCASAHFIVHRRRVISAPDRRFDWTFGVGRSRFEVRGSHGRTSGAVIASANNLSVKYGTQIVFDGATIAFTEGERGGLVGRNGSG